MEPNSPKENPKKREPNNKVKRLLKNPESVKILVVQKFHLEHLMEG